MHAYMSPVLAERVAGKLQGGAGGGGVVGVAAGVCAGGWHTGLHGHERGGGVMKGSHGQLHRGLWGGLHLFCTVL